jgi:hypothetical protein
MADKSKVLNSLTDEQIKIIETTLNSLSTLAEERRSISEDQKEQRSLCCKTAGISPKTFNAIAKLVRLRESGLDFNTYKDVVEKITANSYISDDE